MAEHRAGPAELHYLGTLLRRRATADVLGGWAESGDWSAADAIRVAEMTGTETRAASTASPVRKTRRYL